MSDDTLADGPATGGVDTTKTAAPTGQPGILDSGDKPSNDAGAAADSGADAGTNSSAADTSNMAGQNNQSGHSTIVPADSPAVPRAGAPDNAQDGSSGK